MLVMQQQYLQNVLYMANVSRKPAVVNQGQSRSAHHPIVELVCLTAANLGNDGICSGRDPSS